MTAARLGSQPSSICLEWNGDVVNGTGIWMINEDKSHVLKVNMTSKWTLSSRETKEGF